MHLSVNMPDTTEEGTLIWWILGMCPSSLVIPSALVLHTSKSSAKAPTYRAVFQTHHGCSVSVQKSRVGIWGLSSMIPRGLAVGLWLKKRGRAAHNSSAPARNPPTLHTSLLISNTQLEEGHKTRQACELPIHARPLPLRFHRQLHGRFLYWLFLLWAVPRPIHRLTNRNWKTS